MREARNDEVPYYASRMHSASPRLAISALSSSTNPPVCARFAHLDWGYERFSLSEAGSIKLSVDTQNCKLLVDYILIYRILTIS